MSAAPAYARSQASQGKGRRGVVLLAGAAVLVVVVAGGWMLLNRSPESGPSSATEGLTVAPRAAAADEGLVGMPVTDNRMPAVMEPATVSTGEPAAAATSTVRPVAPPAVREAQPEPAAPLPLDIAVDEPLQVEPQPQPRPQPPEDPPVQQDWDPFLRGEAPISTAEPPLVVTPPVQDQ